MIDPVDNKIICIGMRANVTVTLVVVLLLSVVLSGVAYACKVTDVYPLHVGRSISEAQSKTKTEVYVCKGQSFYIYVEWAADEPDTNTFTIVFEERVGSAWVEFYREPDVDGTLRERLYRCSNWSAGQYIIRAGVKRNDVDPDFVYNTDDETCTAYVVEVEEVAICKPTGDDWAELPWAQVILRGETLRVKAGVNPSLPTGADFTIDVTARTSSTNPTGITVTLDELADSGSVIRGTSSTSSLLPSDPADGVTEFTSADKAVGASSNFNDSDQFDSDMSGSRTQRGKARNGGNESVSPPEGGVSKTFMQAAGVEYIEVIYDEGESTEKKDKNQIQNQADFLYYSGHGSHDSGCVQLWPTDESFGHTDASGNWNKDLAIAIFSACAILDIKDYNGNYSSTKDTDGDGISDHDESPGEAWIPTGPSYLLGYNCTGPSDIQGTAVIIHNWYTHLYSDGIIEAWKIANDIGVGHNACVIRTNCTPKRYYYFKRHGVWPVYWYTWECEEAPW